MMHQHPTAQPSGPRHDEVPPNAIIVPMDPEVLSRIFTPERVRLLKHLRGHGPEPTLEALAAALDRAPSHVGADVRYLMERGLVRVRRDGRRKRVEAVDRQILVR